MSSRLRRLAGMLVWMGVCLCCTCIIDTFDDAMTFDAKKAVEGVWYLVERDDVEHGKTGPFTEATTPEIFVFTADTITIYTINGTAVAAKGYNYGPYPDWDLHETVLRYSFTFCDTFQDSIPFMCTQSVRWYEIVFKDNYLSACYGGAGDGQLANWTHPRPPQNFFSACPSATGYGWQKLQFYHATLLPSRLDNLLPKRARQETGNGGTNDRGNN